MGVGGLWTGGAVWVGRGLGELVVAMVAVVLLWSAWVFTCSWRGQVAGLEGKSRYIVIHGHKRTPRESQCYFGNI